MAGGASLAHLINAVVPSVIMALISFLPTLIADNRKLRIFSGYSDSRRLDNSICAAASKVACVHSSPWMKRFIPCQC
jgi:hypothetical protein